MRLILKWIISTLALLFTAYLFPSVAILSLWTALWLALFLGFLNAVLRPVLILLTLPINILTLGLFTFIINGVIVLLSSSVINGFEISGLFTAILFSVVLSIINYFFNKLLAD